MNPGSYEFKTPWLILCEGESDRIFLWKLIEVFKIHPNKFTVLFACSRYGKKTGGRGNFGQWLSDAYLAPSFRDQVKAILVVSDNDDDPAESWKLVHGALSNAQGFNIPDAERVAAKGSTDYPDVAVLMIPQGKNGNLESLCIEAALNKNSTMQKPLENFLNSTPATKWRQGKKDKMRIHSFLAATCEPQPDVGLAGHWKIDDDKYHIPVNDQCFQPIVEFLQNFDELLAKAS